MSKLVIGILAHVDAGKTTLSEAILYQTGAIRSLGRVDHQNAFLDTEELERERGITIFSKQAIFSLGDREVTLLDTPGHVDFSAEMERALQVLDCAVSVTSMASAPAEGGMEFTAQAVASILYLSEDDALCGVEVDIPVSCRGELPSGCTCSCTCRPVGEATAVPVTGGLEVRFEAEFAWTTLKEEQAACVTDLKPSAAKETGVRPSVVIRRVERGEALWDIAKSCGSTVEDICSANGLPAREAAQGELLLIPARRC